MSETISGTSIQKRVGIAKRVRNLFVVIISCQISFKVHDEFNHKLSNVSSKSLAFSFGC